MKNNLAKVALAFVFVSFSVSCAPKYGCPVNAKNMGAENHFTDLKLPKAKKMKV